jgi:hypothetical protein
MNARNLAPLLLVAALAGCVDNNASVRLSRTCAPPAPAAGVCAYTATCDAVWMDNLWVDTAYVGVPPSPLDGTLYWPFQADNQRADNTGRDGGTNTATAFITGYKITYHSATIAVPDVTIEDSTAGFQRHLEGHGAGRDPRHRHLRRRLLLRDRPVLGGGRHQQRRRRRLHLSAEHADPGRGLPQAGPVGRPALRVAARPRLRGAAGCLDGSRASGLDTARFVTRSSSFRGFTTRSGEP